LASQFVNEPIELALIFLLLTVELDLKYCFAQVYSKQLSQFLSDHVFYFSPNVDLSLSGCQMDVHDIHHLIQLRMQYGVNLLSLYWRWSTLIWARHLVLRRAAHVFPKLSVIVEDAAELASDGDELPLDVLHVFELQHSQW